MKQLVGLFVLLIAVLLFGAWSAQPGNLDNLTQGQDQREKLTIRVDEENIEAEVANSPAERAQGFSGRSSLGQGKGMLFVFEEKDVRAQFWMKGMQFSIDIIWIDDGKVVQIDKNVPTIDPDTPDRNIPLYTSEKPIDYVLETAAGESERLGIEVGDGVEIPAVN